MRTLPIVERELRVLSRGTAAYWGRVGAALLALFLAVAVYLSNVSGRPPQTAMLAFFAIAWLAFGYCLLAGARLTSDCISEERRDGTLGLLFLTDLKGYDIVLGKLAATSVQSLYHLLAVLPVLALPLLMGGVGLQQLARVTVVLLTTLLLSLSVGMFVSCWFSNSRRATGATLLLLLLITFGPWLLLLLDASGLQRGQPNFNLAAPSPLFAQAMAATDMGPGKPDHLFWPSVGWISMLAAGFLIGACALLPRVWRELPRLLPRSSPRTNPDSGTSGVGASRPSGFRQRLLDINPFYWLTARDRRRPWYVLGTLALLGLGWLYANHKWRLAGDPGWHVMTSITLHVVLKVWIALAVVQQLAEERRTGSIELLLSTPLTLGQIVAGQFQSLVRQFGWPLLVVFFGDLLLLQMTLERTPSDRTEVLAAALGHIGSLGLDVAAITLLGLWRSVVARHSGQAAGVAFFLIVVLPCLIAIAIGVAGEVLEQTRRARWDLTPLDVIAGFYLLSAFNSVAWSVYAWQRLKRDFRSVATARFDKRRGGWWRSK